MMKYFTAWAVLLGLALPASAAEPVPFPHPDRIRYDSHGFQIEGRDTFIYGGAFHYFRCPKELWRDRFQKIKDAGFNTVETYVPWNWHEREAPKSPEDFSKVDMRDLEEWMTMAEEFGFYTIIRPGPYICAEWAGGGYPQWLIPLFKPKDWPAGTVWLQTDDPRYLAWSKHWYDAVTRVVAPHQITRKAPGRPGVILFQIENEYERLSWVKGDVKTRHLAALARHAREGGIDVPLVTCWTRQSRNSNDPDLKGMFDFINSYPKWDIGKKFKEIVERQRKEQPYAPLASMELQGGWYSEIGGKLSEDIDGVAPVQTQNLTLFCLQLGYGMVNYYMLFGGTNFDDWASREATTTYDFYAAIREHGGVGEKYRRLAGIGAMLREHGERLVRSEPVELEAVVSDPAVQVALRKAPDGTRYFFVRTEDRGGTHTGSVQAREKDSAAFAFDFSLEPFGSQVLVLPPGATEAQAGEWLPRVPPAPARPAELPAPVAIAEAWRRADPLPTEWKTLPAGASLESQGLADHHFLYYRVQPPASGPLTIRRLGEKVIARTLPDGVLAWADGKTLPATGRDKDGVTFDAPVAGGELVLLYENAGLHHHTNAILEQEWALGIRGVTTPDGTALPLEYAAGERERGLAFSRPGATPDDGWSSVSISRDVEDAPDALLTWYRLPFELPEKKAGVWVPWQLKLGAKGNGFIYLNGHCVGRTWEIGPQREFYLPECWLNFGPGRKNVIVLSLRPLAKGVKVEAASVGPATAFAEIRP